jgi:hypothetical protein
MVVKMKNKVGEIRPGQLITTFGPGAIIDSVNDSLMILDIRYWDKAKDIIYDKNLANFLGKHYFKKVPATGEKTDLPVIPFPFYHECSNTKCRQLFDIRDNFSGRDYHQKIREYLEKGPRCPSCNWRAHPARFVISCEDNHLEDFPWKWWAHGKEHKECNGRLTLSSGGDSSGLESLSVKCECMESGKSLRGALDPKSFKGYKCKGAHPHKLEFNGECGKDVIPLQRGASNVYFAAIRSAISFSDDSHIKELLIKHQNALIQWEQKRGENGLKDYYEVNFEGKVFKDFNHFYNEWIRFKGNKSGEKLNYKQIKEFEYEKFTGFKDKIKIPIENPEFEAEVQPVPIELQRYFSKIIKVHRLKEIMVLLGFMRNESPEPEVENPKEIVWLESGTEEKWLPAVETFGEGIFIEFNRETVNSWLQSVEDKSKKFSAVYDRWLKKKGWTNLEDRNALYVMMHTLSHLLIKQLSLKSGYSSVAIKERIYCSETMAGILLYTGSADQEGTLGGLVEMGSIDKFREILDEALEEAMFCTNDPVCSTLEVDEENDLNGSACFACSMISETSCEVGNRLLDRSLVVPLQDSVIKPYFDGLI